jgi:hypothetical protein
VQAGTLIHIVSSDGEEVLTFAPAKNYQSIAFSSAELEDGATYSVFFGGECSGTAVDGLYLDGAYSSGSEAGSFTTSGIVTTVGRSSRW